MSIFSKIFGARREDDEDETRSEDRIYYTSATDRPAEGDLPPASNLAIASAGEEIARKVTSALHDVAGVIKVVSEQVAAQRAASEALSRTGHKQVELLTTLNSKVQTLTETEDSATLENISKSIEEEIKLVSGLEKSLTDTNAKLSEALEKMTASLSTLPDSEARQAEMMESIRDHIGKSSNLHVVIQELSDRTREQTLHLSAFDKSVREEIKRLRRSQSGQRRTSNVLMFLLLAAVIAFGTIVTIKLANASKPAPPPVKTEGTP